MSALLALVLGACAVFAVGTARTSYLHLFNAETTAAAQRAAEGAASLGAHLVYLGQNEDDISRLIAAEARQLAMANVSHGEVTTAAVTWTSLTKDRIIVVRVAISTKYGGFAGPVDFKAIAEASVDWSLAAEPPRRGEVGDACVAA